VSTSRTGNRPSASQAVHLVGAPLLLAMTVTSAYAGSVSNWSCVGTWRGSNCIEQLGPVGDPYIRLVPEPLGDAEKERVEARDHKWLARCRPTVKHDRYGVARYYYSAPGCEFGVGAD
jgi:hypothetical protein